MGRLICFELKKIVANRFFLIAICTVSLLCFMLQCGVQEYQDYLRGVEAARQNGEPAEAISFFEYVSIDRKAAQLSKKSFDEIAAMSDEELQEAISSNEEYRFSVEMLEHLNRTADEKLDAVLQSAELFRKEAEAEGYVFGVRRNEEILRLYSIPRKSITAHIPYGGDTLINSPAMLLVFLLILLTAAPSVAGEHDRRTWLLLHTAREGKLKTLLAKYISEWFIGGGLTLAMQAVSLLAVYFKGGRLGAGQPVTAIGELTLCPYPLAVWQYAIISLACQIFTSVLLSTILTSISAFSKNELTAYVSGALVLGVCFLLLNFSVNDDWLAGPLALAEPWKYLNRYHVCDLFGMPVPWYTVHAVVWALCAAVLVLVTGRVYCRKRRAV